MYRVTLDCVDDVQRLTLKWWDKNTGEEKVDLILDPSGRRSLKLRLPDEDDMGSERYQGKVIAEFGRGGVLVEESK